MSCGSCPIPLHGLAQLEDGRGEEEEPETKTPLLIATVAMGWELRIFATITTPQQFDALVARLNTIVAVASGVERRTDVYIGCGSAAHGLKRRGGAKMGRLPEIGGGLELKTRTERREGAGGAELWEKTRGAAELRAVREEFGVVEEDDEERSVSMQKARQRFGAAGGVSGEITRVELPDGRLFASLCLETSGDPASLPPAFAALRPHTLFRPPEERTGGWLCAVYEGEEWDSEEADFPQSAAELGRVARGYPAFAELCLADAAAAAGSAACCFPSARGECCGACGACMLLPERALVPEELVSFACELANASGARIKLHFRSAGAMAKDDGTHVGYKDIVTLADLEAEKAMRGMIVARYPQHAIIGEEFGVTNDPEQAEWCWVLDPVDGTRDFAVGVHTWGTLIGLTRGRKPVLGVIDQPCSVDRWVGVAGRPTTHNGRAVRVATLPVPAGPGGGGGGGGSDAVLLGAARVNVSGAGIGALRDPFYTRAAHALVDAGLTASFGGPNAYSFGLLSSGCLDVLCDAPDSAIFDICAAIPVVVGAGGAVVRYADGVLEACALSPELELPSMDPEMPYPVLAVGDARLLAPTGRVMSAALAAEAGSDGV